VEPLTPVSLSSIKADRRVLDDDVVLVDYSMQGGVADANNVPLNFTIIVRNHSEHGMKIRTIHETTYPRRSLPVEDNGLLKEAMEFLESEVQSIYPWSDHCRLEFDPNSQSRRENDLDPRATIYFNSRMSRIVDIPVRWICRGTFPAPPLSENALDLVAVLEVTSIDGDGDGDDDDNNAADAEKMAMTSASWRWISFLQAKGRQSVVESLPVDHPWANTLSNSTWDFWKGAVSSSLVSVSFDKIASVSVEISGTPRCTCRLSVAHDDISEQLQASWLVKDCRRGQGRVTWDPAAKPVVLSPQHVAAAVLEEPLQHAIEVLPGGISSLLQATQIVHISLTLSMPVVYTARVELSFQQPVETGIYDFSFVISESDEAFKLRSILPLNDHVLFPLTEDDVRLQKVLTACQEKGLLDGTAAVEMTDIAVTRAHYHVYNPDAILVHFWGAVKNVTNDDTINIEGRGKLHERGQATCQRMMRKV